MICLLCEKEWTPLPTWKELLLLQRPLPICSACYTQWTPYPKEHITLPCKLKVYVLYVYDQPMQRLLYQYKERQDIALAPIFSNMVTKWLKRRHYDCIVPIPAHPDNVKSRTFAHIDAILDAANLRYQHVLRKTTSTRMSEKSRKERLSYKELFAPIFSHVSTDHTYLLVDDVVTTGNTLCQAAEQLRRLGASSIEALAISRPLVRKGGKKDE